MADMRFVRPWRQYAVGDIVHTNEVLSGGETRILIKDGYLVDAYAKPPEPKPRRGRPPNIEKKPEVVETIPAKSNDPVTPTKDADAVVEPSRGEKSFRPRGTDKEAK